ncbi:uncharacterized protein FIBRA_05432 [Fibroporia radiculosa]|uniref:Uncharacterized protein n=1 Tax=Fibroporia radiculosa TaxID=599839 RepID=J4H3H9_9APHY|nr:uncharacterized protein FIBRA_05432 [Fibroporia radiculosa]CCM03304.1 predicted protein [Fibroporia radiculosa]
MREKAEQARLVARGELKEEGQARADGRICAGDVDSLRRLALEHARTRTRKGHSPFGEWSTQRERALVFKLRVKAGAAQTDRKQLTNLGPSHIPPASFFVRNHSAAVVVAHVARPPSADNHPVLAIRAAMIAVQKPPPQFFAAPLLRPSHSRHPSAPVVVRPTHTPGLLSLSKPSQPNARPQTANHQRQHRSSPRGKPQQKSPQPTQAIAQVQPVEDAKKSTPLVPRNENITSEKPKIQPTAPAPTVSDKSVRGRQTNKPSKDKAQRRSASSTSRAPARRQRHQPSPPPIALPPSQAEDSSKSSPKSTRPIASASVDSTDPFLIRDVPTVDAPQGGSLKPSPKGPTFRSPPPLTQPSGKLARRRQLTTRASVSPSAPKGSQSRKDRVAALVGTVNDKQDIDLTTPVRHAKTRRTPVAAWDCFPICDDSADQADDSDDTPPTTPIRESASVPVKRITKEWHAAGGFDDVPHTAPLSSTAGFRFVPPSPTSTPTPAQRRRNHRRVPSEGMFHMSMDEDSASSDTFPSIGRAPIHMGRRKIPAEFRQAVASGIESGTSSSAPQAGYFAGSMFQNSPSPDELPPPSF